MRALSHRLDRVLSKLVQVADLCAIRSMRVKQ
jgi:hypothetical protein